MAPVDILAAAGPPAGLLPEWLSVAGVIAAALLVAVAVLARPVRIRAGAMLGALVLSPLLLLAEVWGSPQVAALRDQPLLAAGALIAGGVVVGGLAVFFARRPPVFALVAIAALPFRVPIEVGGATANLLLPLYVVVGAGALGWLVPRLRASAPEEDDLSPGALEWLLLGSIVLYALQSAYSSDSAKALSQVVFFYVPFGVLFALLRRLQWTPRLLARCFVVLLVLAVVFVAIGYAEYATRQVFFNPKVIASNQAQEYFRVNSLFFDPSIYGRFLVVVMLGLTSVLVWSLRPRLVFGATAGLALLAGGLLLTLSQSSFAALLAGLATIALLRWRARWTLIGVTLAVIVAAVLALAAPGLVGLNVSGPEALNRASSGRLNLIEGGLELARERTVLGWGSGSFEAEYRRRRGSTSARATAASHTIPVTVAAEQGLVGLAVYLALLVAALLRLLRGARRVAARAALAAAFVALAAHTWMYAAFLEDPTTWALLAVGAALATSRRGSAPVAAVAGEDGARRARPARPAAVPAAGPRTAL